MSKIRILVVEDNLVVQQYIKAALKENPSNKLVEIVSDGLEAVEKAIQLQPDIILLDLFLPGIDGIDVIKRVMHQCPCPIVVISGELDRKDRDLTFEAQRAGAVAVLAKPRGMEQDDFLRFSKELCRAVETMSKVKVVRRWFDQRSNKKAVPVASHSLLAVKCDLLLIGSSTGGPAALYKILEAIAPDFSYKVLISQHIAAGFVETLASWLEKTGCKVKLANHGEQMQAGNVYLPPDCKHLEVGSGESLMVVEDEHARFTPSVDRLFLSAANNFKGEMCALILTGMGDDGTIGMTKLFEKGALTVAESEASCVIYGMPMMAVQAGAIKAILSLDEICSALGNKK